MPQLNQEARHLHVTATTSTVVPFVAFSKSVTHIPNVIANTADSPEINPIPKINIRL